jgi:hypothetical protein
MLVKTKEKPHIKVLDFSSEKSPERITIREYLRNYKKYNDMVNETRESIIITNQYEDNILLSPIQKKRKWTFEEIRKELTFKGGKNLSKNIDKIVYGI